MAPFAMLEVRNEHTVPGDTIDHDHQQRSPEIGDHADGEVDSENLGETKKTVSLSVVRSAAKQSYKTIMSI